MLKLFLFNCSLNLFALTGNPISGSIDNYRAPLAPEFFEHNPEIKYYPESSIKTFGSYTPVIPDEPIKKPYQQQPGDFAFSAL